ncbi:hypothetical protein ACHAXA_006900 [Cyclostephanos tholiformis]|uniref:DUF6824 domain-containing protein n=1 Tax=Cyclostephanos tholiformis TaxID=382380 RepID=A0ABD3SDR8_9STRA
MNRFGLCQTKDDSAREDTADSNQWELLMKQVRVELYSSSSDEFNGRAFELRQLACSQEAGFPRKHNNLCDPPVLESAPGYPYYATSSFVPISPIRSSRTTSKSAKVTTDGPSHQSINHFGSRAPRPTKLLTPYDGIQALSLKRSNADMEYQSYQIYSSRVSSGGISSMSSNMRPRLGSLHTYIPDFRNPDMKCLCPQCYPRSHTVAGEILLMSTHTSTPNQLNRYRQISYTASDCCIPRLSGVVGVSQVIDTDLENEIRATPHSMDNSAQQAENHQKVRNSGFKKDPTRIATPTELDVLAGRGGETNKHLGNLVFREEARKLRVFYRMKDASRDDKFRLSVELVERIKKKGGRFLGKCDEGLWYVMFDDDARKKAIQGEILAGYFLEPWKID